MINWLSRSLVLFLLLAMVGCSSLPYSRVSENLSSTRTAGITQTPATTHSLEGGLTSTPSKPDGTVYKTPIGAGKNVRIWLPPEFDPASGDNANRLLNARLQQFQVENPSINVQVRVKSLEGPGGMLDSLVATSAAAPSDLPDLVLLPRTILESAALKGLLYPVDDLTDILDDPGWFEYALQLAHLKSSLYSIPFAGDALVMARSASLQVTALTLGDMAAQGEKLLYPAADPQALFTLTMYLAIGGKLQDDQGRPALEENTLTSILNYDEQARLEEVMPYTLTQFSDDAQVWEAFLGGQYPIAITWASTFLKGAGVEQTNLVIDSIPTPDGEPFTLAKGWSWALPGQDPVRRSAAVKLAEFLVAKDFMAEWTRAAGYLPPRLDALQSWQESTERLAIERISYSAHLIPPADLLSAIGPALQTAVVTVLEGRVDPQSAAQAATHQVKQP